MPADANAALQASVTKTSTFSSSAFDLGAAVAGVPPMLYCRVIYSAASNASGSNSALFSIDACSTSGGTYNQHALADPIALSTTAQAGEIYIPLGNVLEFIKLTVTISGGGSTPTITYQGDIVPAKG